MRPADLRGPIRLAPPRYLRGPLLLAVGLLLCAAPVAGQQSNWGPWQTYSTLMQGDQRFLTVEFRTYYSRTFSARVQWRITNHSAQTMHCVSIGERTYTLSDGSTKSQSRTGCRKITPGEIEKYYSDVAGEEGLRVTSVEMREVTAATEPAGEAHAIPLRGR